jgi:inner membrane transporter RhtA
VAAIEFLGPVLLAVLGIRSSRNVAAVLAAAGGVYLLTHVRFVGEPLGVAFAFANAALFAGYIVLAHRVARSTRVSGIDGLAAAMLVAFVAVSPVGAGGAARAFGDPVALAAGVGVGVASSVVPYVLDQLAMARLARATYALLVALLPAIAAVVGAIVLAQLPSALDIGGIALVTLAIALHRPEADQEPSHRSPSRPASKRIASKAAVQPSPIGDCASKPTAGSSPSPSEKTRPSPCGDTSTASFA